MNAMFRADVERRSTYLPRQGGLRTCCVRPLSRFRVMLVQQVEDLGSQHARRVLLAPVCERDQDVVVRREKGRRASTVPL